MSYDLRFTISGADVVPSPQPLAAGASANQKSATINHKSGAPSATPSHKSEIRNHKSEEQIAKDFESVLLTRLFDEVQKSLGSGDLEEDGTSQQVQGLFWFYLARDAADKGGFGLWKEIYQQLQQMEATANPAEVLKCEM
jgi:hypothetical protein